MESQEKSPNQTEETHQQECSGNVAFNKDKTASSQTTAQAASSIETQPQQPCRYCTYCGETLDPPMHFCPGCGRKVDFLKPAPTLQQEAEKIKSGIKERAKALTKTQKIIAAVVAAILIVVIGAITLPSNAEDRAIKDARELKSMMKNPSSLTIHGDIIVLEHTYDDGDTTTIIAIDNSGENSYGGTSRDTSLFENGKYLGDYDDEPDVTGYSSEEAIEDALALSCAKMLLLSADSDEYTFVDGEKVAKKIGAQYSE